MTHEANPNILGVWLAEQRAVSPVESLSFTVACTCREEIRPFFGKRTQVWRIHHPLCRECRHAGKTWIGETKQAAVDAFNAETGEKAA